MLVLWLRWDKHQVTFITISLSPKKQICECKVSQIVKKKQKKPTLNLSGDGANLPFLQNKKWQKKKK